MVVNPAVVAYLAVESGDDDVKIVHAGDSSNSSCARGFLSLLGCRAGFQTLKAGVNRFAIRVHNWRTFTAGRFDLNVDRQTRRITATNVAERIR